MLQNKLNQQRILDTFGGFLSAGCAIHCLLVPVLTVLWPVLGTTILADQFFHTLLLYFVIPTTLISFTLGCRHHGKYHFLILGGLGLGILTFLTLTESQECSHCISQGTSSSLAFWNWSSDTLFQKGGLIFASLLLCWAHWNNFRACRQSDCSH